MTENALIVHPSANRAITYTPLAEAEPITLTVGSVMNQVAIKTRSGQLPTLADVIKFMMLCKSRKLNPFVGDAYLVGYDSDDGPTFQLITAIQSLRKRAESNPGFNGAQRGVIVQAGDQTIEREGTMVFSGETLVGGWGRVYRKDYGTPFYETVKLSTYNTKRSRWGKDPEGMIAKVGEAAALRRAFPSDVGALYIHEEFDNAHAPKPTPAVANGTKPRAPTLDQLAEAQFNAPSKALPAEDSPPSPAELAAERAEAQLDELNRLQEEQEARAAEAPRAAPAAIEPKAAPEPPQPAEAQEATAKAALEGAELKKLIGKYLKRIESAVSHARFDDIEASIVADQGLPEQDCEDLLDALSSRRAELDTPAG